MAKIITLSFEFIGAASFFSLGLIKAGIELAKNPIFFFERLAGSGCSHYDDDYW